MIMKKKNIIKKMLVAFLLILTMVTSTVPAFAAEGQQPAETTEKKYVDRSEIYVEVFDGKIKMYQEEYRKFMWGLYNAVGFDITLEYMNLTIPSPHNYEWLKGNVDFYVNALFNQLWLQANGYNSFDQQFAIYGPSSLD